LATSYTNDRKNTTLKTMIAQKPYAPSVPLFTAYG
jgi:hypothetical protein